MAGISLHGTSPTSDSSTDSRGGSELRDGEDTIDIEATDLAFPKHWKSGALKYTDFEPLAEGGSASIRSCLDENLRRTVASARLRIDGRHPEPDRLAPLELTVQNAITGQAPTKEVDEVPGQHQPAATRWSLPGQRRGDEERQHRGTHRPRRIFQ